MQSDTSLRSLIYYSSLLIAARLMGKQCVLWGNGLGRARGRLDRMLICRALRSCDFIGVRDLRSFAIAKHTLRVCEGERGEVSIILEGDLAERTPSLYSTRQRADFLLRRAFGNKPSEIVAAMPRGKSDEGEILRLSKALSAERGRGRELLVIVMNQKEDERLCRALAASLGGKLMTGICFGDVTQMMKECKRAYSMRLHGLVAARMAGIEFVGIGEDSKIRGYCEQNGGRYLPVEENE